MIGIHCYRSQRVQLFQLFTHRKRVAKNAAPLRCPSKTQRAERARLNCVCIRSDSLRQGLRRTLMYFSMFSSFLHPCNLTYSRNRHFTLDTILTKCSKASVANRHPRKTYALRSIIFPRLSTLCPFLTRPTQHGVVLTWSPGDD